MGRWWTPGWLAFALAACAAVAPVRIEDGPADRRLLPTLTLASRLQVFMNVDDREPVAGVSLVVGAGSAQDPPGKSGLAHLVEHLVFRGRPSGDDRSVRGRLQGLGASWNGSTSFDHALFWAFAPSSSWREAVTAFSNLIDDPLGGLDEAAFSREVEIVRNELLQRGQNDDSSQGLDQLQRVLFSPPDAYRQPIGGTLESLSTLTLNDARDFAARYYRPSNATFFLDGDLPPDVGSLIAAALPPSLREPPKDVFGGPSRPSGGVPGAKAVADIPTAPSRLVRTSARVTTPELWVGWSLPSIFAPDGALVGPLERQIIEGLRSDRFRYGNEGIVNFTVHPVFGRRATLLACEATLARGTDAERTARAIEGFVEELANVSLVGMSTIRQRRTTMHTIALLADDDPRERLLHWATSAHFTGDPRYERRRLTELLANDDPLALADAARAYLSADRARAVLVEPTRDAPGLEPIARGEPAPIEKAEAPRPFPDSLAALTGITKRRIDVETLPNGLVSIVATNETFRGATTMVGFHGGTATEDPPGVVEVVRVAGVYSVNNYGCRSFADCGIITDGGSWTQDSTSFSFVSDGVILPTVLQMASQFQEVDWVRWPDDIAAKSYRGFRHVYDLRAEVRGTRRSEEALFPNQRWGHVAGIEDLEHVEADTALNWSRRHEAASNAAVVVVGSVAPKEAEAAVSDTFGSWSAGTAAANVPPRPAAPRARPDVVVTDWPGAPQAQLTFGCRLPPPSQAEAAWQDVFAQVVERHAERILRERVAATYAFPFSHEESRGGVSTVRASGLFANTSLGLALVELDAVVKDLGEGRWPLDDPSGEPFARPALDVERWSYLTRRAVAAGSRDGFARELLHEWNMGWPIDGGVERLAGLLRVEPERLAAMAHACHDSAVFSITGDPAVTKAAIAEALR